MIDPSELTDPLRCPSCGSPLAPGGSACARCGLALQGPQAAHVWDLSVRAAALLTERANVLVSMRADPTADPMPAHPSLSSTRADSSLRPVPPLQPWRPTGAAGAMRATPAAETSGPGAQQVLVTVGAVLLALAALYFLVAGWGHLAVTGKTIVLATVTVAAVAAAQWALRARLGTTAEAISALAVCLATIDCFAARAVDLFGLRATPGTGFAAVVLLVLAAAGLTWSRVTPLVAPEIAAAVLTVAAAGAAAMQAGMTSQLGAGAVLVGASAASAALVHAVWRVTGARIVGALTMAGSWLLGVALALQAGSGPSTGTRTTLGLVAVVAVAVAVAAWSASVHRGAEGELSLLGSAAAVVVACAGVVAAAAPHVGVGTACLIGAGVAVLLLAAGLRALAGQERAIAWGVVAAAWVSGAGTLAWCWGEDAPGERGATSLLLGLVTLAAAAAARYTALVKLDPVAQRPTAGVAVTAALGLAWALPGTLDAAPNVAAVVAMAGAVAVALLATYVLAGGLRRDSELLAVAGAVVAGVGASTSPGTLALALLVAGLGASLVSAREGRHPLAFAALSLLVLALWTWLVDGEVRVVEAYSLPAALGLWLTTSLVQRNQQAPEPARPPAAPSFGSAAAPSWSGIGLALLIGMVPSLMRVIGDVSDGSDGSDVGAAGPRALLLGVAALGVLLWGVAARLQAPLVIGATVLVVDAVMETLPFAASLPRWVTIGAAGLTLLGLGATYERRLHQARIALSRLDTFS